MKMNVIENKYQDSEHLGWLNGFSCFWLMNISLSRSIFERDIDFYLVKSLFGLVLELIKYLKRRI